MSTFFRAAAVAIGGSAVALALASPASAYGEITVNAELTAECGEATLTYVNPTIHDYRGDYRVGDETGTPDRHSEATAKEGPWEGLPLGDIYNEVLLPAGETVTVPVEVTEDTTVTYWVNRGPEQNAWVAEQSIDVTACEEEETDPGEGGGTDPGENEGDNGDGGDTDPGENEGDNGDGGDTEPGDNEGEGDESGKDEGDDTDQGEGEGSGKDDTDPAKGDAAKGDQSLPVTGGALAGLVAAAVAATGAGAGGLWFARKRRTTAEGDE